MATDCLAEAIAGRIARVEEDSAAIEAEARQHAIGVPLHIAPKLAFDLAMRERRVPNTEIAKRLGVSETVVPRMLNLMHDT